MNHSVPVSSTPRQSQWIVLVEWLLFTFAASFGALFVSTGGWYEALQKPDFTPPSWVFGPAWTTLYVLMGVAAWLVWREGGWVQRAGALGLFVVQWLFNAIWTPLFFGAHWIGWALVDIVLLWLLILATLIAFWQVRKLAGLLLVPYLAWVTFASALNLPHLADERLTHRPLTAPVAARRRQRGLVATAGKRYARQPERPPFGTGPSGGERVTPGEVSRSLPFSADKKDQRHRFRVEWRWFLPRRRQCSATPTRAGKKACKISRWRKGRRQADVN